MAQDTGMGLPILIAAGAWVLLFSIDLNGRAGLIFPGAAGWLLLVIALVSALSTWRRRRPFHPPYVSARAYAATWAICAAAFLLLASSELFVTRWMPDAWKEAIVKALHIRRVYRNYGPSP